MSTTDVPSDVHGELDPRALTNGKVISPTESETVLAFGESGMVVQQGESGNLLVWKVTVDKPTFQQRNLEALDNPRDSAGLQRITCFTAKLTFVGSQSSLNQSTVQRPQLSAAKPDGYDGNEILGLPDDVCDIDENSRLPEKENGLTEDSTYSVAVAGLEKNSSDSEGNPVGVRFDYSVSVPGASPHKDFPSSVYWGPITPKVD